MARPRIGLFGGTFDPPHVGHLAALRAAAGTNRYDDIIVTVAGDPYQKSENRAVRDAEQRLELARLAFADLPLVTVSDREVRRAGPSYTIDTVRELLVDALSVDVLVGADAAASLGQWHEAEALRDLVKIGVFPRPGGPIVFPEGFVCYEIAMAPVDLSSTEIRSRLDAEGTVEGMVPPAIMSRLRELAE